jgi:putative flippase GtrA
MSAAALRFAKFSCVGIAGFVVDAAIFQALVSFAAMSPYLAKLVSYLPAVTASWWLNRTFTFADGERANPASQWARSLAANAVGTAVNYAVFAGVLTAVPVAGQYPLIAVAAGALAGLALNFTLSDRFIFRRSAGR